MDGLELRTASTEMSVCMPCDAMRQKKIGHDAICLVAIARVSQSTYLNFVKTTPVGPSTCDDRRRVASVKSGGGGQERVHKTIIETRRQTAASISSQAYKEESLEVVARCCRGKKKTIC
jgi:hypothetical protein